MRSGMNAIFFTIFEHTFLEGMNNDFIVIIEISDCHEELLLVDILIIFLY